MATQVTLNSGAVSSAGSLKLQTNGTTDAVTIDTAQNLGLNVAPSAWSATYKVLQVSTGASFYGRTNTPAQAAMSANWYTDGVSNKFIGSGYATQYQQDAGVHYWFTSTASGTAGNAITFTQAMTLDASGNLGVGTTSPSSYATSGLAVYSNINSTQTKLAVVNPSAGGSAGAVQTFTSDSDQKLEFTLTSTGWGDYGTIKKRSGILSAYGNAGTYLTVAGQAGIIFGYGASPHSEAARIDSSGNLLVGAASQIGSAKVGIVSDTSIATKGATATNAGTWKMLRADNGAAAWTITGDSNNFYIADADFSNYTYLVQNFTAWSFGSDKRIKTDITELDYGLSTVLAMQPKRYKFIASGKVDIGFIAQELREVVPEAVSGEELEFSDDDTAQERAKKILGVGKETLIPILVKAIQEQQAIINAQQAALETLTNRIQALENK